MSHEAKTKPWIPQIIDRFCFETDLDSMTLLKAVLQEA
jgi:hypothetical protein